MEEMENVKIFETWNAKRRKERGGRGAGKEAIERICSRSGKMRKNLRKTGRGEGQRGRTRRRQRRRGRRQGQLRDGEICSSMASMPPASQQGELIVQ